MHVSPLLHMHLHMQLHMHHDGLHMHVELPDVEPAEGPSGGAMHACSLLMLRVYGILEDSCDQWKATVPAALMWSQSRASRGIRDPSGGAMHATSMVRHRRLSYIVAHGDHKMHM